MYCIKYIGDEMIRKLWVLLLIIPAIAGDYTTDISADNVDELVYKGIAYIKDHGERFNARAGSGIQAYDVNYILTNPQNRVHNLRGDIAKRYFCRELLAYFKGSLKVDEGLAQASKIWKSLADKDGNICSNYGYYVFHEPVKSFDNRTQYEWVIEQFAKNLDTRKAFININQPQHKVETNKDFPCTLGMQFYLKNNKLCTTVSSRSTDIYTGLPYDMGFFSLVSELVYKDIKEFYEDSETELSLELGHVMMKTNFTQIYDKTKDAALKLLEKPLNSYSTDMPVINNAQDMLSDIGSVSGINKNKIKTNTMKWIQEHAH